MVDTVHGYDSDSMRLWWPFGDIKDVTRVSENALLVAADDGKFVVKVKDAVQVALEKKLLRHLANKGVPAHSLLYAEPSDDGRAVCVYSFLEGVAVENALSYGSECGKAIAKLHQALASLSDTTIRTRSLYDTTYGWVLEHLLSCDDDKLRAVGHLLSEIRPQMQVLRQLPWQIIHRDAHPGNMIFDEGGFVGFIDFDIVEQNICLFDPCYCAASTLPTEFDKGEFPNSWFSFTRDVFRGYEILFPMNSLERGAVPYIFIAIEALFTGLFIKSDGDVARRNALICLWLSKSSAEIQHQLSV